MTKRQPRRQPYTGQPQKWTEDELKLIGSRLDREMAKLFKRFISAVKDKKFELLK